MLRRHGRDARHAAAEVHHTTRRICLHTGDGNGDAKLRIAEALAGYRRGRSLLAAE